MDHCRFESQWFIKWSELEISICYLVVVRSLVD
uniref:Uncharacterized protein n=1 Tax=Rhizophora mucronata TaxID=61149 RepID=A0A2P2QHP6_RHIMU